MASKEYIELLHKVRDVNVPKMIEEMIALHEHKNAGYAGADAVDPWVNFRMAKDFGSTPFQGCMIRWGDKVIRVRNLMNNPANEQVGESIKDTLMDTAAYSLIAICLLNEEAKDE